VFWTVVGGARGKQRPCRLGVDTRLPRLASPQPSLAREHPPLRQRITETIALVNTHACPFAHTNVRKRTPATQAKRIQGGINATIHWI
jgi:hypothetical protein